ncbi:Plastid ribosomal protein L10, imported to chloroplast, large ribosomal subunit [Pleodorina starrii]|uniref:Plastid ribosomal protein L10, imported to chloroplast, large ribosomal subunit n=1 Tax=Pleodorina starrii TaxID=330485 RepID=A0A9W6BN74_9CHLO|nr:Plastid ribosomal protein L10 [Pleodorina starrii]GLC55247.1 Plastid ribosomal protein L10, imported to chloroplast, large ribosomal subunit [Pleodorina starrii]GLC70998.1 Plastid ribosomal protein L10 [Pleodorina starrii]
MQACNMALRGQRSQFAGASCSPKAFTSARVQRASLQVTNAITRQKKEEVVSTLKEKLDKSIVVFGVRFKGLDVPTIQKFRKGLPPNSSMYVTKNTLMKVAVSQTQGWEALAEKGCEGENAWVFVNEEEIADAVKHYFKFEEDLFTEAKKQAAKNQEVKRPTELSCVVMSGKYLTPAELKKCENLPTKAQLYATIARLAKQPAQKLATGIKAVPTKLAIALKKVSELDDDKSKTLAQVAQA